jgi:ABC-type dipeptide/oligopeptide/nickel transport system permease component
VSLAEATPDAVAARPHLPWLVRFLARRAVWALLTLAIYLMVVFVLVQVWVPFNWATQFQMAGPDAYQMALQSVGLDRPLPERLWEFVSGLATLDLGQSFTGAPVSTVIASTAPVTIFVFAVGALVAFALGEAMGRIGAWHGNRVTGSVLSTLGVLFTTIFPPFLVFLIAFFLRDPFWELREAMGLPSDSLQVWRESSAQPNDVLLLMSLALLGAVVVAVMVRTWAHRHRNRWVAVAAAPVTIVAASLGLWWSGYGLEAIDLLYRVDISTAVATGSPLLVLVGVVLITFGQVMFMMRVGIQDQRNEAYVLTARAKGLTEPEVRDRHVSRNAIAPAIAGSFLALPTLLAGMVIIEFGLEVRGLSWAFFNAVETQDIPTIMGVLVMLGVLGVVLRVAADVVIAYLDPRQREGGS